MSAVSGPVVGVGNGGIEGVGETVGVGEIVGVMVPVGVIVPVGLGIGVIVADVEAIVGVGVPETELTPKSIVQKTLPVVFVSISMPVMVYRGSNKI